ncbi:MAG: ribosome maturation factor RimM [Pseudomonadota bacterium]
MATGDDTLVVVAVILGAHGVRGDLRVRSFTEFSEDAFSYGPLLDQDANALVEPLKALPAKDHFIVTPKTSRQKEEWDAMKGKLLHVPRSLLPDPEDDEIYIDDLVGLSVKAIDGAVIGLVKAVQNFGAGDLLEVAPNENLKTVFVPFTEDDVPEIDIAAGYLVAATFDLWADDSKDEPD